MANFNSDRSDGIAERSERQVICKIIKTDDFAPFSLFYLLAQFAVTDWFT